MPASAPLAYKFAATPSESQISCAHIGIPTETIPPQIIQSTSVRTARLVLKKRNRGKAPNPATLTEMAPRELLANVLNFLFRDNRQAGPDAEKKYGHGCKVKLQSYQHPLVRKRGTQRQNLNATESL